MSGMILNFGARLDYWMPGKYVDDVASDTSSSVIISPGLREQYLHDTFSLFGRRSRRGSVRGSASRIRSPTTSRFSSRTGISRNSPGRSCVREAQPDERPFIAPRGKPDLNPETTVAYELGIRNQLSGNDVLTVTAYYKDIFDYVTEATVQRISQVGGAQYYTTYLNSDYGARAAWRRSTSRDRRLVPRHGLRLVFDLHGKSSTPDESIYPAPAGQPETSRKAT